ATFSFQVVLDSTSILFGKNQHNNPTKLPNTTPINSSIGPRKILNTSFSYPSWNPQSHGMSSNNLPTTATAMASPIHGQKAKRITENFSLFKAPGSSSRPDRVKMTTSAILRKLADQVLSI
ncbi:hypothetical protein P5673_001697, partial [Acropora cervicornis]